jgi:hypothetical protein
MKDFHQIAGSGYLAGIRRGSKGPVKVGGFARFPGRDTDLNREALLRQGDRERRRFPLT